MSNKTMIAAAVLGAILCRSCCVTASGQDLKPIEKASVRWVEDLETKIAELELRIADLENRLDKLEPVKPIPGPEFPKSDTEFDGLGRMPPPDVQPPAKTLRIVPKELWYTLPPGTKNQQGCTWDGTRWICPLKKRG